MPLHDRASDTMIMAPIANNGNGCVPITARVRGDVLHGQVNGGIALGQMRLRRSSFGSRPWAVSSNPSSRPYRVCCHAAHSSSMPVYVPLCLHCEEFKDPRIGGITNLGHNVVIGGSRERRSHPSNTSRRTRFRAVLAAGEQGGTAELDLKKWNGPN
jgi:hypothetical protein